MKRVIILGVGDAYWLDLVSTLKNEAEIDVVFWSGAKSHQPTLSDLYPDCIFHEPIQDMLMQGPAHDMDWPSFIIDKELGDSLAVVERTALMMMDRMDPTGVSLPFQMRKRHFRRLVTFWGGVLKGLQPDLVLFQISPHMVYDYIVYELAKFLGLQTLMFERSGLPGRAFLTEEYEKPPLYLERAYQKALEITAKPGRYGQDFIQRSAGINRDSTAPLFEAKMRRLGLKSGSSAENLDCLSVFKREITQLKHLFRRNGLTRQDVYFIASGQRPEHSSISFTRLVYLRWLGRRKQARLRRKLNELAIPFTFDDTVPYVLLMLHYQPERATLPLGGIFADQIVMAQALSATLPDGWKLVVKEHPWQLSPYSRGFLQRSEEFYDDLAALDNVILVNSNVPTDTLINGAKAVATITGSAGWQAVCRGIPALVFGAAWYKICRGVFPIRTICDLSRAIKHVTEGIKASPDAVGAFISAVEEVAIPAVVEPKGENCPNVNRKENGQILAKAIIRYFNEQEQKTEHLG